MRGIDCIVSAMKHPLRLLAAVTILSPLAGCEESAPPKEPARERHLFHLNAYESEFGYSQAVRVGKTLYISGSMAVDHQGRLLAPGDMAGQMRASYANIQRTLAAMGSSLDQVVSETIYTTDMDALLKQGAVRFEYYDKAQMPATTWVGVQRLADPGFLVAISVVAELP
jgi:2-iminobutanoate/2-iminopropanoate deaminase